MISFLTGRIAAKTAQALYLDVQGVGFEVFMSGTALSQLPEVGQKVTVHTYLQVREDAFALYGFRDLEEKALFERLIGVSGVGPKVALAALSFYSCSQLVEAIMSENVSAIQKVPGVGKKTASRIVLELKGSLDSQPGLFGSPEQTTPATGALQGAVEALLSMGFTSAEADVALKGADPTANEGALLQYALKRLGSVN